MDFPRGKLLQPWLAEYTTNCLPVCSSASSITFTLKPVFYARTVSRRIGSHRSASPYLERKYPRNRNGKRVQDQCRPRITNYRPIFHPINPFIRSTRLIIPTSFQRLNDPRSRSRAKFHISEYLQEMKDFTKIFLSSQLNKQWKYNLLFLR